MAYMHRRAELSQTLCSRAIGQVGTAHLKTEVEHHFGDAVHAGTTDAHEVNTFDFMLHLIDASAHTSATRFAARGTAGGVDGSLSRVGIALDKVERKQTATLTDMEEKIDTKARAIRSVLADLGVESGKGGGVGGPYIPVKAPGSGASAFERQLYRINVGKAQLNQYTQALVTVPVRKPVYGEVDMSSPFGMRMDPFMRGPAIHSGIDLRGDKGDPVRVTANGTVTIAGWNGGYGNMVEVDHGNGLATRYGHMSKIDVKVGQRVVIGQTVGEIGSTGRSTGPHLHYETRIDGEAVDPQKFLRAGLRLGPSILGNNI